jgi:hypothetical protein
MPLVKHRHAWHCVSFFISKKEKKLNKKATPLLALHGPLSSGPVWSRRLMVVVKFETGSLGIKLDDTCVVTNVKPNGQAAQKGVAKGMAITAVNGKSLNSMNNSNDPKCMAVLLDARPLTVTFSNHVKASYLAEYRERWRALSFDEAYVNSIIEHTQAYCTSTADLQKELEVQYDLHATQTPATAAVSPGSGGVLAWATSAVTMTASMTASIITAPVALMAAPFIGSGTSQPQPKSEEGMSTAHLAHLSRAEWQEKDIFEEYGAQLGNIGVRDDEFIRSVFRHAKQHSVAADGTVDLDKLRKNLVSESTDI